MPWRHIVRNSAFWALLFAHTSYTWGFYTLLNDLPLFLKNILHFDLTEDGVLSSIPYICNYFFMFIQSLAADGCLKRGWISLTALRKTCNSIGESNILQVFLVQPLIISSFSLLRVCSCHDWRLLGWMRLHSRRQLSLHIPSPWRLLRLRLWRQPY